MSRGTERRGHVTVDPPVGGRLFLPICVAWVECACGERLARVSDTPDGAVAGLAEVEAKNRWQRNVCGERAERGSRG